MAGLDAFVNEMNTIVLNLRDSCRTLDENNPKHVPAIKEQITIALAKAALLKKRLAAHKAQVTAEFQRASAELTKSTSFRTAAYGGRRKGLTGVLNQGLRGMQGQARTNLQAQRAEFTAQCANVSHHIDSKVIALRELKANLSHR